MAGPRLQVAIVLLSQTGGHGDTYSERVGVDPDPVFGHLLTTVDGVDDMRVTVRRLLRDGADCIKLCTSGGVVSPTTRPGTRASPPRRSPPPSSRPAGEESR